MKPNIHDQLATALQERDAARAAGQETAHRFGQCMEELQTTRASLANVRALAKDLETKLRDSIEPPCSSADLESLRKQNSYFRTENEAYQLVHQRDQAEIEDLKKRLTERLHEPGPGLATQVKAVRAPPAVVDAVNALDAATQFNENHKLK